MLLKSTRIARNERQTPTEYDLPLTSMVLILMAGTWPGTGGGGGGGGGTGQSPATISDLVEC